MVALSWQQMPPYFGRWVELWGGCTLVAWGLVTALTPLNLADSRQLAVVARFGTNCEWANVSIALGIIQATAAWVGWRMTRWGSTTAAFLVWVTLADGVFLAPELSPGIALYIGWALADLVSVMRVLRRAR